MSLYGADSVEEVVLKCPGPLSSAAAGVYVRVHVVTCQERLVSRKQI